MTTALQLPLTPRRNGATLLEDPGSTERLARLLDRVEAYMRGGEWHTLRDIAEATGGQEASVSARLRDLRRPERGGYTVERRLRAPGLYEYRVTGGMRT